MAMLTIETYGDRCPFCGHLERLHIDSSEPQMRKGMAARLCDAGRDPFWNHTTSVCDCAAKRARGERAIPLTSLEIAVGSALFDYDTIFLNRADVLNHLFLVGGNGYDWREGRLVELRGEKEPGESRVLAGMWPKWRSDEMPRTFADVADILDHGNYHNLGKELPREIAPEWRDGIIETMKMVILRAEIPVPPAPDPFADFKKHLSALSIEQREALISNEIGRKGSTDSVFDDVVRAPKMTQPRWSRPDVDEDAFNKKNAEAARRYLREKLGLSAREVLGA